MDAKNSRIYYAVYKISYEKEIKVITPIWDPSNNVIDIALENITKILSKEKLSSPASIKIIGDCANLYEEQFEKNLSHLFNNVFLYNKTISGESLVNMAENYIRLGYDNYKKDYLTLDALYVRPSQAERAKNNEL